MGGDHMMGKSPSASGKGMVAKLKRAEDMEKSRRNLLKTTEEEERDTEQAPPRKRMGIFGRLRGRGGDSKTGDKKSKKEDAEPEVKKKEKKRKHKKEKETSTEEEPGMEPAERIEEEDDVKERRGVGQRLRSTTLWNKTLDLNQNFKNWRRVRARKKPIPEHQLHNACAEGNMERIKYLLVKHRGGANETYREMTPLQYAIKNEQMEVIRYLINDQFAQIGAGFQGGAFMVACEVGNKKIVEFLHKTRPASPTDDTGIFRLTPLMIAADKGHVKVCKYLIKECGVDVNATNSYGYNALHCAAAKGHLEVVQFLAKSNADGMAVCNTGETALHRAVMFHHVETADFLLENYPQSIHVRNEKGQTPVDLARKHQTSLVATLEKKAKKIPNPFEKPAEPKRAPIKKVAVAAKKAAL
eukprot:scaffold2832_cov130-Amphora_coffeaeformis.AAC.1